VVVDQETGEVTVHRLVIIQDVGRAINPLAVEGQLMGGAMQGLGWALHENMIYDDAGQNLTASLMDYVIPHFTDSPVDMETMLIEVAADTGPLGARGVGELPVVPTAGAVANAIKAAVNIRITDIPMTAPRVLAALQTNQNGQG
jgi:CO/xanthine dehydrogenase Mo-binding subunit